MNIIKSILQTHWEESTFDDLMLISMNGVAIDKGDFVKAIDNWKIKRRILFIKSLLKIRKCLKVRTLCFYISLL